MLSPSKRLLLVLLFVFYHPIDSLTTCPRQCICHEHSIACSCETSEKSELIISSLGSTYITSLVVHTCDKVTVQNGSFSGVVLVDRLTFIAIGRLYFEPHAFKGILQSPRQLVIDDVTIPSLAPVAFAGLSHIDHFWIRKSQIDVIAMEAFHYLTNIDYIYFHQSKIGRIERKAFSKMYQIDHLYFKDSVEIGMIESEAFSESQVDELIFDGITVESAHDTFLLNLNSESTIFKNSTIFLIPRQEENVIELNEEQKTIERCLIHSSNFNILSPYKLGCNVLEVSSSNIQRIGPVSRDIDTPVFRPEPSLSASLNSVIFSNCSIGSVDSYSFTNYTLSILQFDHSKITSFKSKAIEKSKIQKIGFEGSKIEVFNESSIHKSTIKTLDFNGMEIEIIEKEWIQSSTISKMRIMNSKIENIEKNVFKDSSFGEIEVDGNRITMMDSEAFYGDNQISTLSVTANDLTTSTPSPSLLSPFSHPTSFILANNTIDCSPSDCSTNSFLLNSPKHSPLLYQISNNRCRPPSQSPCVEPRSITIEDHGITCRISSLLADCACTSSTSSIPSRFPIDANISIVVLGDCEHLTLDQRKAEFSQIYIFRTSKLVVLELPRSLKVFKIFHSTVSLMRQERYDHSTVVTPQSWEISNSKVDLIGPFGLSNLQISTLYLHFSRLSHIPSQSTRNSKIQNLIIQNCFLESTQPLFEISETLQMSHSVIFSSPRGLGTISSAQLQNNTLLECCRHPFVPTDYRNPMGLDTIDMDPRCDLHFYGSRCFNLDSVDNGVYTNLPITSSFNCEYHLLPLVFCIFVYFGF
ncbi:hypothetical protein L3Y34_002733 [Caenorhabditis briggsae]|uniref:Uncharacterized protein n=1 Tax=Caenorhabditis briggsae TaxID=6238 RepID=A0AAE9IS90_CAEBR|nr:hypothetical protein L3Y34_002733 [Caenorhabditis briggsae]